MLGFTGNNCLDCNSPLKPIDKKSASVVVYGTSGSSIKRHDIKVCTKKSCRAHFHHSHFTRRGVFYKNKSLAKFFYNNTCSQQVFVSSCATAFEISFLHFMLSEIVVCPEYSFYAKATAFNMSIPTGNTQMCRKRLTEAFFLFALLEMMRSYQPGTPISSWAFSHDLDDCLLEFTPTLKQLFQGRGEAQLIIVSLTITSDAGHNIVADGWAGASNPHQHPKPHPADKHTQILTETLVFPLFD